MEKRPDEKQQRPPLKPEASPRAAKPSGVAANKPDWERDEE